jgi:HK97 family phage major capsid protein
MPYNNIISRTDAAAEIPEDVAATITGIVAQQSAALTLFRNVPMSRAQTRIPALSALPVAYFVNGDTGLKQTTEAGWENKYLNAEEIAAIVPIPEAVLDDAGFDIWATIRPLLAEAIGRTLDAAVFFGTNAPASWSDDIVTAATAASHTVDTSANAAGAAGGNAQNFSDLFALVEADGYDVNGVVLNRVWKGRLRSVRSTTGENLTDQVSPTSIFGVDGERLQYPMRGLWPAVSNGNVSAIVGDFTQGLIGVRQDITYKILDQAVIQDGTGAIIFNLAQQDMVAMRVVARYAWAVPNPYNRDNPTEATRYPFAVMTE